MADTVHMAAPASARVSDAYRWTQLSIGVAAMVMIANYQYGWTFFVPDIQKTAELVQEVSAACTEQATGVQQMSKAITQVDQVTQRNAAAGEELASTAEEVASQAESLQQLIAFFKVGSHHKPSGPFVIPSAEPQPVRIAAMSPATNVALRNMLAERARQANGGAVDPTSVDAEFQRF